MSKTSKGYEAQMLKPKGIKLNVNPTMDEVLAAVDGTLRPRAVKGGKRQEELTKMRGDGQPGGRPLGVTTGLPINMAFCYMLQQNERAPDHLKHTDDNLIEWLRAEFPRRPTIRFENVQSIRNWYQQGRLTRGIPPRVLSHRYDSGGRITDTKYKYKD